MKSPRTDARGCERRTGGRVETRGPWWTLVALALLVPCKTHAAGDPPQQRWVSLSLLAGSAQPIAGMADYQWDVRPHAAWGAEVLAGTGPFSTGVRWWRAGTTQGLGLVGVENPAVHTSSIELVTRARVAHWRVVQLLATASGGRLAITYQPDRLTVDAGGTPVEVALAPLHEWIGGAGLALSAPLAGGWTWGVETERRMFSLETAHRSGSSVTLARETFGDWSARAALSRAWDW